MAREFKGKAGTIYTQETDDENQKWDVWFEDFCIIGCGATELEALRDARSHAADIGRLVADAIGELSIESPAAHAPTLTEEEAQLVIGAIPLQALPDSGSDDDATQAVGGGE